MPRLVALRLILNGLLGVALLGWLRLNTDWGDAAGTVLALGGIFSWVAVVGKLFDDERQKQLRRFLADWLFETRRAWGVAAVLAALLLLTAGVGSVEVANQKGGDALVAVGPATGPLPDPKSKAGSRVAGGGRSRELVLVSPFGRRPVTAKVDDVPSLDLAVRPWWRAGGPERVVVPGSFLRPVVLVLGPPGVLADAADPKIGKLELAVFVNDQRVYREGYDGRAVLIGTRDNTLPFPAKATDPDDAKILELVRTSLGKVYPPAVGSAAPLAPSEKVYAVLYYGATEQERVRTRELHLHPPADRDQIVQLLFLKP